MGLLDSLFSGSQGGYGGLLDSLMYTSPLNQPQAVQQPQYDPMGNYTGITPQASSPFPMPQFSPQQFAPPSAFNGAAPAAPVQFAQPQAPAPQPPQAAAPVPAPVQAPQDSPINNMQIGGYQMPQFGSAADYTPTTSIPANAQPAQGQLPAQNQGLPPAFGGGNYLDRINNGGSLIGSLFGDSGQQKNMNSLFQSAKQTLIDNGMSPREAESKAMLAVINPTIGNPLIQEALTNKEKYQKTGVDGLGNETYGFVNERDQTINGKPLGQGETQPGGGFLAPGVKAIDSTLTGGDYLKQFSPEVQAAVQNYVDGKSMPTGNPRKGFTQAVKMIAQKVGADTGQSVDDTTYAARRTMRNQLSSSAPASLGGQINIGNTAAGHLADLTQKALELGNVDTGIAPLSALVNNARGLGTDQAAKMEALKGAAQHYGQEITKFYAGSPGGTAERDRFIESVNGARSPKELAAILSTEGELMRSRLDALGGQIKGVLGDEGAKQYPVLRADGQAALSKVEENVSRLKGNQPASTSGIPSGWSVKVR